MGCHVRDSSGTKNAAHLPHDFAVRKGHFHGPLAPQAPRDSHSLGAASPRSPVSGCPHRALRVANALGLPEASTGFFFWTFSLWQTDIAMENHHL